MAGAPRKTATISVAALARRRKGCFAGKGRFTFCSPAASNLRGLMLIKVGEMQTVIL